MTLIGINGLNIILVQQENYLENLNVNYEAKNTSDYKTETTSELFGALGLLTEIDMYKETKQFKTSSSPQNF